MAKNRFSQQCLCLRFDDAEFMRKNRSDNKISPIRNTFESCTDSLQDSDVSYKNVTFDEQLVSFTVPISSVHSL